MSSPRVWNIADLHVDYKENMQFCEDIDEKAYLRDTIIISGDISHEEDKFRKCLSLFVRKFHIVAFVPGNHDLWVPAASTWTSVDKFYSILAICRELGVRVTGFRIPTAEQGGKKGLWIVPLYSWYDGSLSPKQIDIDGENSRLKMWSDFYRCHWPRHLCYKTSPRRLPLVPAAEDAPTVDEVEDGIMAPFANAKQGSCVEEGEEQPCLACPGFEHPFTTLHPEHVKGKLPSEHLKDHSIRVNKFFLDMNWRNEQGKVVRALAEAKRLRKQVDIDLDADLLHQHPVVHRTEAELEEHTRLVASVQPGDVIMTTSHFLPHEGCMPDPDHLIFKELHAGMLFMACCGRLLLFPAL